MSYDLRNYGHVMFLTIQWALQDREAMLEALNVESDKEDVRAEIRAIRRLREKIFGGRETKEEHFSRTARSVSINDLRNIGALLDQATSGDDEDDSHGP